jgi:hypothetical protein
VAPPPPPQPRYPPVGTVPGEIKGIRGKKTAKINLGTCQYLELFLYIDMNTIKIYYPNVKTYLDDSTLGEQHISVFGILGQYMIGICDTYVHHIYIYSMFDFSSLCFLLYTITHDWTVYINFGAYISWTSSKD